MKSLFFRLYLWGMSFLASLRPIKEKNIVVLNGSGRSGSNGYLFYKYIKAKHPDYNITLVEPWPSSHLSWETWKKIGTARYVITTHQPFKARRDQVNIQFWHGVPLKRMGFMAHNTRYRDNKRNQKLWHKNADLVTSSSDLYESLMSACMAIEGKKYQKLGFPRIDYIDEPAIPKEKLLADLFKTKDDKAQIGIYMPTFRYELEDKCVMEDIKQGNYFSFLDFDPYKLNDALKANHQYLIVKLHPYEMRMFDNFNSHCSNISFLNNDYLFENDLDLYELLGDTEFLITDFSSIYFDYLYLNKPIIFITNYLEQYEKVRGLLLSPYEDITPGPCVNSQKDLIRVLRHPDNHQYREQRFYWLSLIDEVDDIDDIDSCEPIFKYMTKNF